MLRKVQAAFPQKLGAVNYRMHQDIFSRTEMSAFLPGKDPVLRHKMPVMHDLFTPLPLFFIDKIADKHIQSLLAAGQFPKPHQYFQIGFLFYPVVAVHHFKVQSGCVCNAGIYGGPMPAVLLVNCLYDCRVLVGVAIRNPGGLIFGAVVNHQNFHILPACQQGFNTVCHIILRIVAGNRNG